MNLKLKLRKGVLLGPLLAAAVGLAQTAATNEPATDGVQDVSQIYQGKSRMKYPGKSDPQLRKEITEELIAVRYSDPDKKLSSVERVRAWNRKAYARLNRLRGPIAGLLMKEKYAEAYAKLKDVLVGISDSILDGSVDSGPYVSRLILRGRQLFNILDEVVNEYDTGEEVDIDDPYQGNHLNKKPAGQVYDKQIAVTKVHLLLRFMDLIDIVDRDFDHDALPYVLRPENRGQAEAKFKPAVDSRDLRRLQRGFIKLVQSQLYFLNSSFDRNSSRWFKADPVGEPEVYLAAIQIMAFYASHDLANNIFGYQNSTAVDDLVSLRESLLEGGEGREGLGDVKTAYKTVVGQVDDIISELKSD